MRKRTRAPVPVPRQKCPYCGKPLYRRQWDSERDYLTCENWECPRHKNKIKSIRREE